MDLCRIAEDCNNKAVLKLDGKIVTLNNIRKNEEYKFQYNDNTITFIKTGKWVNYPNYPGYIKAPGVVKIKKGNTEKSFPISFGSET